MNYVDGYVVPVPTKKLADYRRMARKAGKIWMSHGALAFTECVADDVPYGELTSFPRAVQATDDEVVIFSFITYRDCAHRDEVNAKVMADPRMDMDMAKAPFDAKRMIWGGFQGTIEA